MLAALDGFAPPQRDTSNGPVTTTPSTPATSTSVPSPTPASDSSGDASTTAGTTAKHAGHDAGIGIGGSTAPTNLDAVGATGDRGSDECVSLLGDLRGPDRGADGGGFCLVGPGALVDPLATLTGFGTERSWHRQLPCWRAEPAGVALRAGLEHRGPRGRQRLERGLHHRSISSSRTRVSGLRRDFRERIDDLFYVTEHDDLEATTSPGDDDHRRLTAGGNRRVQADQPDPEGAGSLTRSRSR